MAKGTIVVSLRSKGLQSFNKALFLDVRYQAVQFATEFLDIFLAAFVSLASISWTSWISISVTICSIAGTRASNYAKAQLDLVFIFFMYIVLPLLILLTIVFGRRERALRNIAELKAAVVSLLLSRPSGSTQAQQVASENVHRKAVTFMEDLRQYLQHRRPYARHFYLPYRTADPSPTDELLKVSRELGLLLRKVQRGVRDMHLAAAHMRELGFSDGQVAGVVSRIERMHVATELLSNIKEMRTPVVLRASIRWFVVVIMPVAFGPFWNYVGETMEQTGLAGILGVLTHIALMSVVDTVVALEDPFDDTALDAISLYEVLDQVGVMTTQPADVDGYDIAGLGSGAPSDDGGANGAGGDVAQVAMYVGGNGPGAGGPGTIGIAEGGHSMPSGGPAAHSGVGTSGGGAGAPAGGSSMGPSSMDPSSMAQSQAPPPGGQAGGGAGQAAMRGSATSDTAVGPPSALDGGGGQHGGQYGGSGNMPSITSPPLPDVAVPLRGPVAMPPMPALAGNAAYRASGAGGGPSAVQVYTN